MARSALTGTRIRERRLLAGIKQAALAQQVGISPAYLNLIEHNRRKIGGKLLVALARGLHVDVATLTEGAQTAVIDALREAGGAQARDIAGSAPELDRLEDFAGRFPGWADLIAAQRLRITALERNVAALTDRLAHDPYLSQALHEVLSMVTAVRATAGILANGGEIERDWQLRFHRNIYEDSQRLAQGAQALVSYLDSEGKEAVALSTPLDELEGWLAARDYHLAELEGADPAGAPLETVMAREDVRALGGAAQSLLRAVAAQYLSDAQAMPLAPLSAQIAAHLPRDGLDPAQICAAFGTSLAQGLRRLAAVPATDQGPLAQPLGFVSCDGSGTVLRRKGIEGFAPPRFGPTCPLWPLYGALQRPMQPLRQRVALAGQGERRFVAFAICAPQGVQGFNRATVWEAVMLLVPEDLLPADPAQPRRDEVLEVGTTCRLCPKADCAARREPSVISGPL
ncbi:helix-turn-helix protein [Aquimixticola soesokkakensis]|uniref:Helix-turn-helix protein n=1 Tax=Aquimixticola soesokkakensis TaxID=1519096 RepID=A0A1Y5T7R0_9RHOB|nr:XRE family transcriptional regulator [Aquimixticola soesokkakensis]SLN57494.1 helix-turn-helix protein [Aquimixticola soesokkakensis]